MITCEEEFALVKQHHMTPRVPRNWNDSQVFVKINCVAARNNTLNAETLCAIVPVHDAFARITFGEAAMIGHVIFMCEKHPFHASQRVNFLDELGRKAW